LLARLFVFFGGLLVLALSAAVVAPYFIDWTSYRAGFEREASTILGRSVTVEGEATARILPFPSVTFEDVAVAGGPNGEPAMTVEEFSMDAELAPFMRGEFLIFDMRLVRPKMTVSVDADGAIDWTMRPSTPMDPAQIAIEKLTVTEGQVRIRHAASGRDHLLSEINTVVSARSLDGPWRVDGSLRIDGMRTALGLSTGKVDENGTMRLRVKADPAIYPIAFEADGDLRLKGGAADYAGTFRLTARDEEEQPLGDDVEKAGKAEAPAWRVNGKLTLDHRRLAIEEFRYEAGPLNDPYVADGSAFVALDANPRFEVKATGAQVRFDETIAPEKSSLTLEDRVAAIRATLLDLPRPTIPGLIDVDLPAVVAGDTTIRDVKLQAEPVAEGWKLKGMSASLPGRTTLEGQGLLKSDEETFGFTGSLLLAVGQPSGFAAWLSRDVDEAIRRLPAAGFKADVDLTQERQSFRNLELILGRAKFQGEIENDAPADANPSMRIALTGDALDVDGLAAFSSLFVSDTGGERFAGRDLDIKLKAGPVSAGGLTAESLDTVLRVRSGDLEVDRLTIGGLAGATVSAAGKVTDFAGKPEGNLDASIVAVDLAPLIDQLAAAYPANPALAELDERSKSYPGLFEDAEINVVGSAVRNEDGSSGLAFSANGMAGGTSFDLTISGNGSLDAAEKTTLRFNFSGDNDDAGALIALYGVPSLPIQVVGKGRTTLSAEGTLADGLKSSLEFNGDDMQARFDGTLQFSGAAAAIRGTAGLEAADVEPWLMTSGLSFPGMGMGTPVSLNANLDYANHLLVVSDLTGEVADGPVSGDVNAEIKDGIPHIAGDLAIDAFDLTPVAAMVLGDAALQPVEAGWPSVPFQSSVVLPFTSDLDLTFGSLAAGIFGDAEDVHLKASVDKDGLRLADVSGKLHGGEITGLFEARNNVGSALVSTQFKLTNGNVAELFEGSGLTGKADVTASLSATGKSIEALFASLSGSGTATVRDLQVPGINAGAFPAILAGADKFGRNIDAIRTAAFAPPIVADGTFAAPPADIAFTVAAGVLRAPPVTLAAAQASLASDFKADFSTGLIGASGAVTYAAGDEALVGSEPSVGFTVEGRLGAISGHYDTEALAQFLTQRALEQEQARVEALQASLIEKQRLRRETRYYASLQFERDKAAEALRKAEEEARRAAEEKRRAEEAAKAAEEERRKQETEAKRKADEAAKAEEQSKSEEDARRKAEEAEAKRKAEEAQRKAEQTSLAEGQKPQSPGKAGIERAPLPPPSGDGKAFDPEAIGNFLKTLGE
jgi:uncharacterized protein involved in outer membrane biogenesis